MKDRNLLILVGIYLIIDAIISIWLANVGRITLHLPFISDGWLFFISQIFRGLRLVLGVFLIAYKKPINQYYLRFLGLWLAVDGMWSIILANKFTSWDDFLRVSRVVSGLVLISR